jgi:hypothetical protein
MLNNKTLHIQSAPKMQAIIDKALENNIYVVELDGFKIQDAESFLVAIEEGFKFPLAIDLKLRT